MASEEYKESDLSKIVKRLMDEEGFEFGEAVREAMEQTKNFESKADGGSIGIEVLFTDKMANGGRAGYVSGGAALKLLEKGKEGIASLYNAGKSIFSKGDDVVDLAKQEEIFRSGDITTDFLENVDDKVIKKFVATRDAKGPGGYGLYDSFDDMPNGLKAAELISRIKNAEGGINYEAAELFIGKKLKGNETVNELISMVVTEKKADGGRVGLFMGGDPLTGQALAIYNSMNAYGFDDQAIANALTEQGLYTAPGSTPPETTQPNIIGSQINQGNNNFSPFNPDPNRIQSFKKDPSVMPAFEALQRNQQLTSMGIKDPFANEATLDGAYYGDMMEDTSSMTGPAKVSGLQKFKNTLSSAKTNLLNNPLTNALGFAINPAMGAVKGIASLVGGMLPPNQRAITENIAGNMGIRVDDIGRIVNTGNYQDPNNVMAGYSLNQLSEKTFDNRIGNISETLADKYGFTSSEIQDVLDGTYTGTKGYNSIMGKTTNLIEQLRAVKLAKTNILGAQKLGLDALQKELEQKAIAKANKISQQQAAAVQEAIADQGRESAPGRGDAGNPGGSSGAMTDDNAGTYCFDPSTPIQMADGSTKEIKNIQLGDDTKGGEVTGVFQFKATDEIHDYKGVTVAGSHYVKEDGKFIMVKDSPLSIKIDKIPVVYSLDTTGRRIFINDIEFADYNGDGVAKNFLTNAGVDLTGFDTEVLRQVEHRLI